MFVYLDSTWARLSASPWPGLSAVRGRQNVLRIYLLTHRMVKATTSLITIGTQ